MSIVQRDRAAAGFLHHEERHARIQTADAPAERHNGAAFVGGYVPPDDAAFAALRQCRNRQPVDAFEPDADYGFQMDGTYLYGGLLYSHFGHVMSEMVHRILTSRQYFYERPWIFVGLPRGAPLLGYAALPSAFQTALDFLDVAPEDVLLVHQNARVAHLQIAEQGSDFGGGPKPGYLALLEQHTNPKLNRIFGATVSAERIFVSRSALGPTGISLGDRYLEGLLEAEGWQIFHPERHPLADQLQVYRRSRCIVFPEGSACHGLELLGSDALDTAILIERRANHRGVFENIMKPRSRQFARVEDAFLIRSVGPWDDAAVYLHNIEALAFQLRASGAAKLAKFDVGHYIEAARSDLAEYIAHRVARDPAQDAQAAIAALHENFEAAVSTI